MVSGTPDAEADPRPNPGSTRSASAVRSGPPEFDLIVVGGGSAGFAAAIAACELGKTVGLVNSGPLGGTCTNRGCIPSKALIRAAEGWWRARRHPYAGLETAQVGMDWAAVQAQKDQLVSELRRSRYEDVLAAYPDISLLPGGAAFQPDGSIRVDERSLRAHRYLVATGARPRVVPFPGVAEAEPLDSTTLMSLPELPESLVILGGRAVALELGQMMARFGVQVTILQRSGRLVPDHEPEVGRAIREYLHEEGIQIVTGVRIERLSVEGSIRVVHTQVMGKDRQYRADQVLLALGRRPNTDGLALDAAGVEVTNDGAVEVNELLQTSNPTIFAVGDVTPQPEYVYVAAAAGTLAARNAFSSDPQPFDLSVVPGVIFTDPQIATVGLTESQAQAAGHGVRTSTIGMDYVARAQVAHDPCGLVKLVADSDTGKVVGAHVVSAEAGEVIQAATIAIKYGLTIDDLNGTLFPYLTYGEALRLAAVSFDKDLGQLSCCI